MSDSNHSNRLNGNRRKIDYQPKEVIKDAQWLRLLANDMKRNGYDAIDNELRCIASNIENMEEELEQYRHQARGL